MSTSNTEIKGKEFTNDSADKQATGAIKYDGGKSPVFRGAIDYFPRAISAVAGISAFGASKYEWGGWRGVEGGEHRYADALVRHLMASTKENLDPDSNLPHLAHAAWNSLAILELYLDRQKEGKVSPAS